MNNILAVAGVVMKELYRRKDAYVLFILTVLICLVMASVNIFHDDKIVRYLKEICLLLIWVCSLVIAITTTARQIPMERENRTLFPLLAKPLTRAELLLGKFLGCWLACGCALVCFYAFFGVLAATREHHWPLLNYAQAAGLHWAMLAVVIAFTLLGSLIFAAPSSNATIVFVLAAFILILGRHLNQVAVRLPEPRRSLLYLALLRRAASRIIRRSRSHYSRLAAHRLEGLRAGHALRIRVRGGVSRDRLPHLSPPRRQLTLAYACLQGF